MSGASPKRARPRESRRLAAHHGGGGARDPRRAAASPRAGAAAARAPVPRARRRAEHVRRRRAASSAGTLTLGTKNFTEEFIVGQLYKQALEAKGCKINYKENIGATEIVDKALTSGQIDAYPEYTGESVATVAKINKTVTSPQQEYALAKAFYAKRGQVMSQMTPFFDTDAIAVLKTYAKKYGLVTTADLKKVPHFTLGARPEFLDRQEGAAGMKSVYGINNFTFKSLALGIQYQALDSGSVDAIDVFTTDPQLASGKYTVLKDPKNIFGFQNIALVINKNKLSACPNVLTDRQRGQQAADRPRDHLHEQGGRDRQAAAVRCRSGVPEGQPPDLELTRQTG